MITDRQIILSGRILIIDWKLSSTREMHMRLWLGFMILLAPLALRAQTDGEALFLRRIADFWEEGEYQIAKSQMEEFIGTYPESSFSDALSAALGDLYLREKNFSAALKTYAQIQEPAMVEKAFLNRMQCLYEMQWYATLAEECESYLETHTDLHATYFLAIALYHQALSASKEPENLSQLAQKAKTYFEILSQTELAEEITQGYAHICYLLKDFPRAAALYFDLAKKNLPQEEDFLFQAALIQAEYDKNLASKTFKQISQLGQKRAKEAAYNQLVLSFDAGDFEALTQENLFAEIPPEKIGEARLFLGKSLLHLKKFPEAIQELKAFLKTAPSSEPLHTALLHLLDASSQSGDLPSLEYAIEELKASFPQDAQLPKAHFSKAILLKKVNRFAEAKEELQQLLNAYPDFEQKGETLLELAWLAHLEKNWKFCAHQSEAFLHAFPDHPLLPLAWKYFLSAFAQMTEGSADLQASFLSHLETFFQTNFVPESEKGEWKFLYAQTQYQLHHYEKAIATLESLPTPNSRLLLAFCYREGREDLPSFTELAKQALSEGADCMDSASVQIALFNAYLALSQIERAAEHLYFAFQEKGNLKTDNLFWLASFYHERILEGGTAPLLAQRIVELLTSVPLDLEPQVVQLAKAHSLLGQWEKAFSLLEKIESPELETKLLLAECYAQKTDLEKAIQLFDEIVQSCSTVRSSVGAVAALQGAKLKLKKGDFDLHQIAIQLKTIAVQKTWMNEPVHLEAALEYIDLQAGADPTKKISLLSKMKTDFQSTEDLLSKDYHEARNRAAQKGKFFQDYMQFVDAQILAAQSELDLPHQKDLQAKSKTLLLQIAHESALPALQERAKICLDQ